MSDSEISPAGASDTSRPVCYLFIHDDYDHSYPYVVNVFETVFKVHRSHCLYMAEQIDVKGKIVIGCPDRPSAERVQQQLRKFGADPYLEHSTGPLLITIESTTDIDCYAELDGDTLRFLNPIARERESQLPQLEAQREEAAYVSNLRLKGCVLAALLTSLVLFMIGKVFRS